MFLTHCKDARKFKSGLLPKHIERFVFVVQGLVTLTNVSGVGQTLMVFQLLKLLPRSLLYDFSIHAYDASRIVVSKENDDDSYLKSIYGIRLMYV
ncbi:hypothetical protein L6452_14403 [Arctium lappa]|uniref:Uncharacterized protein n=1 Tax=Arctium lappa TaxID=4217 RepID=A0ACB9CL06_ARCLA|nr:hypothetical protein L6452_14403 [Arctium lappa]